MRRYWVYILKCSDGTLYTGCTVDLERRLLQHNSGRGSRYTRSRLPVTLAYTEEAETLGKALRREFEIRRLSRREKLLSCASYSNRKWHSMR